MRDNISSLNQRVAIPPQVAIANGAITGSIIDLQGYDSASFVIATGTLASAAQTFTVSIEEGNQANLSDAVVVSADKLIGTIANASFDQAADNACRKIGYRGACRYIRLTLTLAGTAGNAPICAIAQLGSPGVSPAPAIPL